MFGWFNPFRRIRHLLLDILDNQEHIMATQAEHAQGLRDLKVQNEKSRAENAKKLKALQDALDQMGGTTPEVDAAMADLKDSLQAEDDENPDDPPPPPPP